MQMTLRVELARSVIVGLDMVRGKEVKERRCEKFGLLLELELVLVWTRVGGRVEGV
jgi:hypothetical protein